MKRIFNKKGLSYFETAAWVLALSMILSVVISVGSLMVLIQTAESNTERVLDSFVTKNSQTIYSSLKNGHDTTRFLDQNLFLNDLLDEIRLDSSGGMLHYSTSDGEKLYSTTMPHVDFEVDQELKLQVTYDILLPIRLAGRQVTVLRIPQKVVSYYNLKH